MRQVFVKESSSFLSGDPFPAPQKFAEKCRFKLVRPLSGQYLAKKSQNCPKYFKLNTTLPFVPMLINVSFVLKSDTNHLTFPFSLYFPHVFP